MKRLVYSPSINVWIKTDTGVFDLSPYVTNFVVDRRIDSVSYVQVTFRNPKKPDGRFMFTEHDGVDGSTRPMFHPMDPIIVTLTRLRGRPIQVFTGYCDTTPYVQLFQGEARLEASCTLKRLQYTFWDPALPFVRDFMAEQGWGIAPDGTALNPTAEGDQGKAAKDTNFAKLLYNVLKDIGGWDPTNIFIQELPSDTITQLVANLYKDTKEESASSIRQFHEFLANTLGIPSYGLAESANSSSPTLNPPTEDEINFYLAVTDEGLNPDKFPSAAEFKVHNNTPGAGVLSSKALADAKAALSAAGLSSLNSVGMAAFVESLLEGYQEGSSKNNMVNAAVGANWTDNKIKALKSYVELRKSYQTVINPLVVDKTTDEWKRASVLTTEVFIPFGDDPDPLYKGVYAIGDGKIVTVKDDNDYIGTKMIVLELDRPIKMNGKSYPYIKYGHIDLLYEVHTSGGANKKAPEIVKGQSVKARDQIGIVGKSKNTYDFNGRIGLVFGVAFNENGETEGPLSRITSEVDPLYTATLNLLSSVNKDE